VEVGQEEIIVEDTEDISAVIKDKSYYLK